jgi:hypothetical protein
MKRKIFIAILGLIIVSQLPFAYRRYRLKRLRNAIQQLASQRVPPPGESEFVDYQGVIHVHSSLGGHSTGNFAELIAAANANQLDFVIMTEHPQPNFDTAAMTLSGMHAGVLFMNGNEVATSNGDRLLLIPGPPEQKAGGGLSLAAYPADSQNWQTSSVDGLEVYNLFTNTRESNRAVMFFDGLWSYGSYPELMFANFFVRPTESLRRWDETILKSNRKLVATAGNDAHSNVGLSVKALSRESLLEAIALGHCYLSFDIFGEAKGFSFTVTGAEQKILGDEIEFANGLGLKAGSPLNSRFMLIKDGSAIDQKSGTSADFPISAPGVYRVEAYLDSLPAPVKGQPWIISTPIYVRVRAAPASLISQ